MVGEDGAEEVLPGIDRVAVDGFAQRYFESIGERPPAARLEAGYFGDSVQMADRLLALVLAGAKRATAGAVADYEAEGDLIPAVGDLWVACDGGGEPRAVLRTLEVRVATFDSVDVEFAFDEGEGDRSLDFWVRAHTEFFERRLDALGLVFDSRTPVVFERFDVVFAEWHRGTAALCAASVSSVPSRPPGGPWPIRSCSLLLLTASGLHARDVESRLSGSGACGA